MSINKKIKQSYLSINRWKAWLFCLLSATLILACTGDLDNEGYALVSPSFGITIIPQNPQIIKAGNQTFTATGGVTPYTYYLANTSTGTSQVLLSPQQVCSPVFRLWLQHLQVLPR